MCLFLCLCLFLFLSSKTIDVYYCRDRERQGGLRSDYVSCTYVFKVIEGRSYFGDSILQSLVPRLSLIDRVGKLPCFAPLWRVIYSSLLLMVERSADLKATDNGNIPCLILINNYK